MNMFQDEATAGEFWFSFMFFNVAMLVSFICARKKKESVFVWVIALLFCVYAFWDTDYYSFRYIYFHLTSSFRDPLYYYLAYISLGSYSIYRLIIWGVAMLLFYKTCNRFGVSKNLSVYIFVVFFLLTFSFARASLGMTLYFYGLSCLLKPNVNNRRASCFNGIVFICLSYLGHRSMLPLILLTPLAYIHLTKKRVFILGCIFPVIVVAIRLVLQYFIKDNYAMGGQLSEFSDAVRGYATVRDFELNWKFKLITVLRNMSHYVLCLYLLWSVWLKKQSIMIPPYIKGFVTMSVVISIIALALSLSDVGVASVTSKRYLYMTGIPLCISLAYTVQKGLCSWRMLNVLLMVSVLWAEGYFIGKIISHY